MSAEFLRAMLPDSAFGHSEKPAPHSNHSKVKEPAVAKPSKPRVATQSSSKPVVVTNRIALRRAGAEERIAEHIPPDPMLETPLAAKILGRTVDALKKWRQRKTGPAYLRHHDGQIRYRLSDIRKYLEDHTVVPQTDWRRTVASPK